MTKTAEAREVVLRLDGITKRFGSLTANDAISLARHVAQSSQGVGCLT